ncbi:sugar phosphate isomerase/epimerase [Amycolatopsis sp. NBC_00345]|uniref:sugar phosphate isomerase/epimerase family protein n=1 Tax=Amycolatopsis sp. NBC_00345 TaxID=2975955 RepID=UPI002E2547DE
MIVPGLVSVTFRDRGVPEIIDLAGECGLRAVEWGGDVHVPAGDFDAAERTRARCAAAGIAVAAYGSYYRAGESDPAELGPVLDTAALLGAPLVRVWAGRLGSAESSPHHRALVTARLRAAGDAAQERGLRLALEYHVDTLTDTLESTQRLLRELHHPAVVPYWQPRGEQPVAPAMTQIRALLPEVPSVHVFSWGPPGPAERLPLADRGDLWQPVLAELAADGLTRHALLEFVAGDDPDALRRDAATLLSWID